MISAFSFLQGGIDLNVFEAVKQSVTTSKPVFEELYGEDGFGGIAETFPPVQRTALCRGRAVGVHPVHAVLGHQRHPPTYSNFPTTAENGVFSLYVSVDLR